MLSELAMRCRDPTASCFDLRSERLDFCFPGFFSAPLWFQHAPDFLHPRFHRGLLATTAFSTRLPPFLVHCTRTADCLYIPFFSFPPFEFFLDGDLRPVSIGLQLRPLQLAWFHRKMPCFFCPSVHLISFARGK